MGVCLGVGTLGAAELGDLQPWRRGCESGERKESEGVARAVNWAPLASLRGTGTEWNSILISFWLSICESLNVGLTTWVQDLNRFQQHKGKESSRGGAAT